MNKALLPLLFFLLLLALAAIGSGAPEAQTGEAPQTGPPQAEAPETFVPSEKLPADSAISFPVDI